jgi:acetate kinase
MNLKSTPPAVDVNVAGILTINGGSSSIKFALFQADHALRRIGLGFLGVELEEKQNAVNAGVISTDGSRVTVRVMRTDEEWMIAKTVCRILGLPVEKEDIREKD